MALEGSSGATTAGTAASSAAHITQRMLASVWPRRCSHAAQAAPMNVPSVPATMNTSPSAAPASRFAMPWLRASISGYHAMLP